METNDILNDEPQPTTQPSDKATDTADTLTTEEAVIVNGGTPDAETTESDETEPTPADLKDQEIAELKDKFIRLYADFENFRRRTAKEKLDLISNANEGLLVSLLPVVDDFERAMQSLETSTDLSTLREGVGLIQHKLAKTLESKGLKPMTAKGETFDADLHESVTQFPAPTDDLKGKVIEEIEKGYYLNDKVIRFAKVIIGS
ncbi:MAG: nucleotide exchange factor GrpE [Bacteroidetes bacterium]|nr:nucleotide exchange factor GrpE [Fibrella sp.]